MDYVDLASIVSMIVPIAFPIIGAIYTFVATRNARQDKALQDIATRLTEHDTRLLKVEGEMKHLPDKELVTELRLALADLKGTVGTLGEKVSGVAHTVGLIDESLRRESGR